MKTFTLPVLVISLFLITCKTKNQKEAPSPVKGESVAQDATSLAQSDRKKVGVFDKSISGEMRVLNANDEFEPIDDEFSRLLGGLTPSFNEGLSLTPRSDGYTQEYAGTVEGYWGSVLVDSLAVIGIDRMLEVASRDCSQTGERDPANRRKCVHVIVGPRRSGGFALLGIGYRSYTQNHICLCHSNVNAPDPWELQ